MHKWSIYHLIFPRRLMLKWFRVTRDGWNHTEVREQLVLWCHTILYATGYVTTTSWKLCCASSWIPGCFVNVFLFPWGEFFSSAFVSFPVSLLSSDFFAKIHIWSPLHEQINHSLPWKGAPNHISEVLDSLGKKHSSSRDNLSLRKSSEMYLQISSFRIMTLSQR